MIDFERIVMLSDFGVSGPYVGQMELAYYRAGGRLAVTHLMHDLPAYDVDAAAVMLAALLLFVPRRSLIIGVVDPGVGSDRRALYVETQAGYGFLGPDNGLFPEAVRVAGGGAAYAVDWPPVTGYASFHGRDLFSPAAAYLSQGMREGFRPVECGSLAAWGHSPQRSRVVYIDTYGNAWTGLRAASLKASATISIEGQVLGRHRVFSDVPPGQPFWYENSLGLVEVAVNRGSAAAELRLQVGTPVLMVEG